MYETIQEFIKPEFVLLTPVLYVAGTILKTITIPNKWIPLILRCFGVCICAIYVFATMTIAGLQSMLFTIFTSVVQGILCAGASVHVNQIVKQSARKK